jgi:hypothetical protein
MAKRKDESGWWIGALLVAAGVGILYYVGTGLGTDNDSALLPNRLERKIDLLIARLNEKFDKRWVDVGLTALTNYVRSTLPPGLVGLVDVVVAVENESRQHTMTSQQKQQRAVQLVRGF